MSRAYDSCLKCKKPFDTCIHSLSVAKLAENAKVLKGSSSAMPAMPQGIQMFMCPTCFCAVPDGFTREHYLTHQRMKNEYRINDR